MPSQSSEPIPQLALMVIERSEFFPARIHKRRPCIVLLSRHCPRYHLSSKPNIHASCIIVSRAPLVNSSAFEGEAAGYCTFCKG